MRGGTAPTTAPTAVFHSLRTFRGVYTSAYSPMLATPSAAVSGFVHIASVPTEAAARTPPKVSACAMPTRPAGRGRPAVRRISASVRTSHAWLNTPAAAAAMVVPASVAISVPHDPGAPAIKNPAPAVSTTSEDSRALDSSA